MKFQHLQIIIFTLRPKIQKVCPLHVDHLSCTKGSKIILFDFIQLTSNCESKTTN